MPGTIIVDDEFTGFVLNTTITGRIPPITNSSYAFAADAGAVLGGGSNDVKFVMTVNGSAAKIRNVSTNLAVQATIDTKGGNESFGLFTRDSVSTPYPRYGYVITFNPSEFGGISGSFNATVADNYNKTFISGLENVPWIYASNNINVVALESIGSEHRIIINGALAGSFTNSTFIASTNNRCGIVYHSPGTPSILRMERFSILDSVVVNQSIAYTVVRVS